MSFEKLRDDTPPPAALGCDTWTLDLPGDLVLDAHIKLLYVAGLVPTG